MYGDRGNRGGGFAPVSVGEELDVRIEAVGEKGDGIAKKKGFVLFVPNAKEGSEVRIKITKVLKKVGFAEVVGDAQGPIEEDSERPSKAPAREESREEVQDAPDEEEREAVEDSENFGEESDKEE